MTLDPSNPAHVTALRWACALVRDCPHASKHDRHLKPAGPSPHRVAVEALHDPALTASLLRALLERCGVQADTEWADCYPEVLLDICDDGIGWNGLNLDEVGQGLVQTERLPALILTLLDIPADAQDRRERAMAVLKEHGR